MQVKCCRFGGGFRPGCLQELGYRLTVLRLDSGGVGPGVQTPIRLDEVSDSKAILRKYSVLQVRVSVDGESW
jgi:hypothetical protein